MCLPNNVKVYISAHSREDALKLKVEVEGGGSRHTVVSTWHDEEGEKLPVDKEHRDDWDDRFARNRGQIKSADQVVIIPPADGSPVPGDMYVEAGLALGYGKPVMVAGPVPNGMLNNFTVTHARDVQTAARYLG